MINAVFGRLTGAGKDFLEVPNRRHYRLERPARKALGNKSPELVWENLKTLAWQAVENHYESSQQLAKGYGLPVDLNDFLENLEEANPIRAINEFHYSNPKFDLQRDLIHQTKPLEVLEALIRVDVLNDAANRSLQTTQVQVAVEQNEPPQAPRPVSLPLEFFNRSKLGSRDEPSTN